MLKTSVGILKRFLRKMMVNILNLIESNHWWDAGRMTNLCPCLKSCIICGI